MAASFLWIQTDVKGVTIAIFRIVFSGSPVFVMLMPFSILFWFDCVHDGLVCRVQVFVHCMLQCFLCSKAVVPGYARVRPGTPGYTPGTPGYAGY